MAGHPSVISLKPSKRENKMKDFRNHTLHEKMRTVSFTLIVKSLPYSQEDSLLTTLFDIFVLSWCQSIVKANENNF